MSANNCATPRTGRADARPAGRRRQVVYGDFQTPPELAEAVCQQLDGLGPATIIEPTCGTGTILAAAVRRFPAVRQAIGFDIDAGYVAQANERLSQIQTRARIEVRVNDFFETDWRSVLSQTADPILIVGNPPWVTNAVLSRLASGNHPRKENRQGLAGIEALTGKSNFDVSEWMLLRLLEAAAGRRATLAMLCKTAVAQKVLNQAWKNEWPIEHSEIRQIDAAKFFGARVDACLLICRLGSRAAATECRHLDDLWSSRPIQTFGRRDSRLVADVAAYDRVRHLIGGADRWRSGVKHDCAAIFEFRQEGTKWHNGLGEIADLERRYLFPMLKSSHVAGGATAEPCRKMLVPQQASRTRDRILGQAGAENLAIIFCGTPSGSIDEPAPSTAISRGFRSSASARTHFATGK